MTYAISLQRALDSVYAYAALEAARTDQVPAIGRGEQDALLVLAREILRRMATRLGGLVRSADFDSNPDIVTLDLGLDENSTLAPVAGNVLCSSLCLSLLGRVYGGSPNSAEYETKAESELAILLTAHSARLTPCSY